MLQAQLNYLKWTKRATAVLPTRSTQISALQIHTSHLTAKNNNKAFVMNGLRTKRCDFHGYVFRHLRFLSEKRVSSGGVLALPLWAENVTNDYY